MSAQPPLRVLSVIPPMTQLNTPYPSTAYLTGFLRSRGVAAVQEDLALALVLQLLSPQGLRAVAAQVEAIPPQKHSPAVQSFAAQRDRYLATIAPAIAFLQGRDSTLAHRIVGRNFLPEGPRFESLDVYVDDEGGDPLGWAFGALGLHDRAKHLATLYLNDLADVLRDAVDPRFEFVRYAESLAGSQPTFEPLAQALAAAPNLVDETLRDLTLAATARSAGTTKPPPSTVAMCGCRALMACAMRKAAYTDPGNGTDSSTTVGWWRATASCVSCSSSSSTSVGGAANAVASGSNVGWLPASDSA